MTDPDAPLFRRRPGAMEARLGPEELVLLGPDGSRYVGLDAVAADVWAALEQPRTLAQVAEALAESYDAAPERIAGDIAEMLEVLEAEGLVERGGA
ncbi:PqqD family protein [Rhodovulum sp. DZ06]|uniref:PqqD family protein n=1 Tax=Rhodovulum sp. DZ06 TaxID=3425126 RepID=UPI003D33E254